MCSNGPCENSCVSNAEIKNNSYKSSNNRCRKCEEPASILLRSQDSLCKKCFLAYCKHKFRGTLGKAHLVKPGDKILIAFSGGCASTALLHMIKEAIAEESRRKLLVDPVVIFVDESCIFPNEETSRKNNVIDAMLSCGFPSYYTSLEMVYRDAVEKPACVVKKDVALTSNPDLISKLQAVISNFATATVKEVYLRQLKEKLLIEVAQYLECKMLFVADSASRLSVQLLSGMALGGGSHLGSHISLSDNRRIVPIARPLREFLARELALYNHFHNNHYIVWPTISNQTDVRSSIFRLTESFVTSLQSEFPATVSTVFRIGSKLDSEISPTSLEDSNVQVCSLCHVQFDNKSSMVTSAAEALAFSERISSGNKEVDDNHLDKKDCLCFGCQILIKDMNHQRKLHLIY